MLPPKNNRTTLNNKQKTVDFHQIIYLIMMKVKMKMKHSSYRHIDTTYIDQGLDIDSIILNIKSVSMMLMQSLHYRNFVRIHKSCY